MWAAVNMVLACGRGTCEKTIRGQEIMSRLISTVLTGGQTKVGPLTSPLGLHVVEMRRWGGKSICLQNTDGGTRLAGMVGVWWQRDDILRRPEPRWLPSGRGGTVSERWGQSACATHLWPACWTWGWSHRAEPPAPTPFLGCCHPAPKSWPPRPPCVRPGKSRRETGKQTISGARATAVMYEQTSRKHSAEHTQFKYHSVVEFKPKSDTSQRRQSSRNIWESFLI